MTQTGFFVLAMIAVLVGLAYRILRSGQVPAAAAEVAAMVSHRALEFFCRQMS